MRLKEFQEVMKDKKIDVSLLYNLDSLHSEPNMLYFSGYSGLGVFVIPAKQKPFLIVPQMEYERAALSNFSVYAWKKKTPLFEIVKKILTRKRIKVTYVGIDKTACTLDVYSGIRKRFRKSKYKDISLLLSKLRQVKTKQEISTIKQGCRITDLILNECFKHFKQKKFKTESDVAAFLEFKAKKYGDVSFPPIVASGRHAAQPHYMPRNIPLKSGFCVIDFGIKYKGYCTDITRTIYLGKPSKKEIQLYNFLLQQQEKSIQEIKINDTGHDIYTKMIHDLGNYAKYFTHGLGHGIGVKIHELPNVTQNSKDKFVENMIFTVEPGIYIQNKLGIRLEDDVLLTKKGPIVLTKTIKQLTIFGL